MITCDCHISGKTLEGNTGHTSSCNRLHRKEIERSTRTKKVVKELKKVSPKMAAALREYVKLKKQFLEANPKCEVFPEYPATEIHHAKGRATIELLLDTNFWKAVSRRGHIKIEESPTWAKANGFSLDRLAK